LATKNIRDLIHIVLDSALQEGRRRGSMAGKGGKGLIAAKTAAGKDKKLPISRSSRAGLQVRTSDSDFFSLFQIFSSFPCSTHNAIEICVFLCGALYYTLARDVFLSFLWQLYPKLNTM
jgi:hypothetical protein